MATTRQSFSFTNSAYIEAVGTELIAEPGQLEIEYSATAKTVDEMFRGGGSGGGGIIGAVQDAFFSVGEAVGETAASTVNLNDSYNIGVEITINGLGRIEDAATSAISSIASSQSIRAQVLEGQAQNLVGGFNIPKHTATLTVPVGQRATGSNSWTFQPITIPVPEGESAVDRMSDRALPEAVVTISVPDIADPITSGQQTFRVKVPAEAFIEEVELDSDCRSLHPETFSQIQDLSTDASSAESGAQQAVNRLEDIAREVASEGNASTGSSISGLASNVEDLTEQQLTNASSSAISRLKTRAQNTNDYTDEARELDSRLTDLKSQVDSQVSEQCQSDANQALNSIESDVESVQSLSDQASDLRDAVLSVPGPDPVAGAERQSCSDRYSSINRQIESLRSEVLRLSAPLGDDVFDDVIEQSNTIIQNIETTIPADDPCRQEMTEKVRRLIQSANQLRTQIRVEIEEAEAQGQRDQIIEELLSSIEEIQSTTNRDLSASTEIDGPLS